METGVGSSPNAEEGQQSETGADSNTGTNENTPEEQEPQKVWGANFTVSDDASDAGTPLVNINESGDMLIVWTQESATNNDIFASYYSSQLKTWSTTNVSIPGYDHELPIINYRRRIQLPLSAHLLENGDAIILFQLRENGVGENKAMGLAKYDRQSGSWSSSVEFTHYGNMISPNIAVSSDGKVALAWTQSDNSQGHYDIYYTIHDETTDLWAEPQELNSNVAKFNFITWTSNGDLNFLYTLATTDVELVFQRLDQDGNVNEPIILSKEVMEYTAVKYSDNNIAVAWVVESGDSYDYVNAALYTNYSWGDVVPIGNQTGYASSPAIAASPEGNIMVAWQWAATGNANIYYVDTYYNFYDGESWIGNNAHPYEYSGLPPSVAYAGNGEWLTLLGMPDNNYRVYSFSNGTWSNDNLPGGAYPRPGASIVANLSGTAIYSTIYVQGGIPSIRANTRN